MKSINQMSDLILAKEIVYVKSKVKTNELATKYLFYLQKEAIKREMEAVEE